MEADMKCIANGSRSREQVYQECVSEMEKIFMRVKTCGQQFKRFFGEQFSGYQGDDQGGGGPGSGPNSGDGGNGGD